MENNEDNAIHASIHACDRDIGRNPKSEKSNAIHASIHASDRDIGHEDEEDNAIHASIHKKDATIGISWIKGIMKKQPKNISASHKEVED